MLNLFKNKNNNNCKKSVWPPCCLLPKPNMCICRARWTLWWVCKCGLFCRLHLGLHMVQQTVVREAGGHMGIAHLQWDLLHFHTPTGYLHKWQSKVTRPSHKTKAYLENGGCLLPPFLCDNNLLPPSATCDIEVCCALHLLKCALIQGYFFHNQTIRSFEKPYLSWELCHVDNWRRWMDPHHRQYAFTLCSD